MKFLKNFSFFQFRFAIPDTPYSIVATVGQEELNTLVNTLLQETSDEETPGNIKFEFLISNEYLK